MKKRLFKFHRRSFTYPYLVVGLFFVVVPLLLILFYAFTNRQEQFSLSNLWEITSSKLTYKILADSILLAILTSLICLLIAYPLALLLSNAKFNRSKTIVLIFVIPMWVNFLLRTYALRELLSLFGVGIGYKAVLIGMVYDFFPFMLLPLYTTISSLDKSHMEAGCDLGASPIQNFFRVILPLSVPGIVSGVIMTFMPALSTFAINDLLGDARLYLFGNWINDYYSELWNFAGALAFVMLVFVALLMLGMGRLNRTENKASAL
ncbi:MAG: ABC transporter permease [Firmicutes bacterium]|nr:ABC transporter permease [Bacillota bacterium]